MAAVGSDSVGLQVGKGDAYIDWVLGLGALGGARRACRDVRMIIGMYGMHVHAVLRSRGW